MKKKNSLTAESDLPWRVTLCAKGIRTSCNIALLAPTVTLMSDEQDGQLTRHVYRVCSVNEHNRTAFAVFERSTVAKRARRNAGK